MDANSFLQGVRERQRRLQRERFGATCPHCETDILDALEERAYDWGGYGEPSKAVFECPVCEGEIEFELEWQTTLCHAVLVDKFNLCPQCGKSWPVTETIRADGSLGCPCQELVATAGTGA